MQRWLNKLKLLDLEDTSQQGLLKQTSLSHSTLRQVPAHTSGDLSSPKHTVWGFWLLLIQEF